MFKDLRFGSTAWQQLHNDFESECVHFVDLIEEVREGNLTLQEFDKAINSLARHTFWVDFENAYKCLKSILPFRHFSMVYALKKSFDPNGIEKEII